MTTIRPAAVAGTFYPSVREDLQSMVEGFLPSSPDSGKSPKVLVGPHAGYVFSGGCAGTGYGVLQGSHYRRVVLLGPTHRVAIQGLATTSAQLWQTPLGSIPIDQAAITTATETFGHVHVMDHAHALEHGLEVHLPFLQVCLGDFTLIPLVVGHTTAEEVSAVLEALWGDDNTLIVISTDLSHFYPYEVCCAKDRESAAAINALDWQFLDSERACGFLPTNGLLRIAQRDGMTIQQTALCNSGDMEAGDKARVVGYGSWVLYG